MATLTGTNLLDSIIDSTGIEPNALIYATLSAKLQQMIDNGTYSKLAAGIAVSGFSTEINAATDITELSDAIEINAGLIEDAADEAAVDAIDFPDYEAPGPITLTLTSSADAVDEGGSVDFTIAALDGEDALVEGTEIAYSISGIDTDDTADDLTGTATVGADGTATVTVTLAEDLTTEGEETMTFTAGGAVADVVVNDTSLSNTNDTRTFEIAGDATTVTEGDEIVFTVTASEVSSVEQTLTYTISGVTVEGVATPATPVDDLGVLNGTVVIAADETTGTFTLTPSDDSITEGFEAFKVTLLNADNTAGPVTGNILIQDAPNSGQSFTLTTGVDEFTGGAGNDTFTGVIDGTTAANETFTSLDDLDGGDGDDVLKLNNTSAAANDATDLSVATISNIETINIQAVGGITDTDNTYTVGTNEVDFSSISGLETINATKSTAALVKAADTTDVNVSGATGDISVLGGKDVSVTDNTASQVIDIGDGTDDPAGSITVTDNDATGTPTTHDIEIDGGTDVTVTATSDATSADIIIGAATEATGAVSVTQNVTSDATGAVTAGGITVTGGSTIDITSNLTTTASDGNSTVITDDTITATAGDSTTDITVTQNVVANDYDSEVTTPAAAETAVLTFGALAAGEAVIVGDADAALTGGTDLTFIASKALTAEEVAAAFANLTNGDTQASGGVVENGYFTGALDAGWTSGAADGDKVTFTSTTEANIVNDLDVQTDADGAGAADDGAAADADFSSAVTQGVDEVATTALDITGTYGDVVVNDNATASVTTLTIDGFDAATIGTTNAFGALNTLNLSNGTGTATVDAGGITSLALNVDGMAAGSAIDTSTNSALETLNLTATGSASDIDFTATDATTVNITADANLDLSGGTFIGATDIDITGAGDVALDDVSAAATDVTASTATGDVSATIDNSTNIATGSGADVVTVEATATNDIDGTVDLGAGNDTLVLDGDNNTVPTGTVNGGADTDTVSMTIANAQAYDNNTNFATAISGFERLTINDQVIMAADADITLDMEALGFDYVTLAGGTDDTEVTSPNKLVLDNMANNGTVVLEDDQSASSAQASTQVNVKDAATGTADTLNLKVSGEATIAAGNVTANDVEALNIEAEDVFLDDGTGADTNDANHTLTAAGDSYTSVTVTGDDLTLDTDSAVLTSVDASAMTGGITYTADGDAAGTTVQGGQGTDALTAAGSNDVLYGNDGADTLTGASLTDLYGGDGADTFMMNVPTNVNSYSTIMDLEAGDVIDLADGGTFVSSAIDLADTAVFQDYANEAINQLVANSDDAAWFEYDGNTYVVENGAGDAVDDFINGEDGIIQITGVVDLSTASYNQTNGTLEIA